MRRRWDHVDFLELRRDSRVTTGISGFLSDQCKETEENYRMGKTRYLFKKIRDSKGIFHAKIGSIKDRNGMYLTEAEDMRPPKVPHTPVSLEGNTEGSVPTSSEPLLPS